MKLYNTLTRKKEEFKPIKKGKAGFYSCGPTVYNYAHLGNLRSYVFADILQRVLEYNNYKVKRVMNITDVGHLTSDSDTGEDKMEKGAREQKKTVWEIAKFYTDAFLADIKELNIKKPKKIIKATDTIKDQIKIIKILIDKGYAYDTQKAVYFDVAKFKNYGQLSGQKLSDKLTAARDEVVKDSDKKNPADFVLWFKLVDKYKNHTMRWSSPWGEGFPGWHIECSAIASKALGQPFDIHTGGVDHIGTHHSNEIAQSETAFKKPLAHYWLHGEFLLLDKDKMAKSGGDFLTLQILKGKGFNPLAYRYLLLTTHYRSTLNFSWDSLEQSQNAYDNLVELISVIAREPQRSGEAGSNLEIASLRRNGIRSNAEKKFTAYINDDLDTPGALAFLWEIVKSQKISSKEKIKLIKDFDKVFGLDLLNQAKRLSSSLAVPSKIKKLAKQRWELKLDKKYDKADKIRLELAKKGYEIKDSEQFYIIKKS